LITKTGTAILGSGLLTVAISQELYGFNEETVIAAGYILLFAYIAKVRSLIALFREFRKDVDRNLSHAQTIRLPYKEWAENHIARIKGVLDGARAEHTQAVKDRIDEVGQMKLWFEFYDK
jgi:F-type H+-transporting ATPase subunit b